MNHNARFANMTSSSPKCTYIRYISGLNDFSSVQSKVHQLFVNRSFVITMAKTELLHPKNWGHSRFHITVAIK